MAHLGATTSRGGQPIDRTESNGLSITERQVPSDWRRATSAVVAAADQPSPSIVQSLLSNARSSATTAYGCVELGGAEDFVAEARGVDASEIVGAYGAAWNEPDEAKRTALLETSWADDGVYQDPTGKAEGRAALIAHIGGFQTMFPGRSIDLASGVDVTEAAVRWAWVMRNGDEVELEGTDFAELAPDGRIRRLAGFFGPLPPLETEAR
jgi:hypothetical protein